MAEARHHDVLVVGAGFGGLGAGIRLKAAGRHDFAILEADSGVGGTWHANRYPGAACDIPSLLYSFSFAPNAHWTRHYPRQPEIEAYLADCVRRFGLAPHLQLATRVLAATWDEAAQRWTVEAACARGSERYSARVLIAATGGLSRPALPALPGLDDFAGPAFHTARWRDDVPIDGRRIGIVGTGASAIQLLPQLAPRVAQLSLFQRTPPWVLPKADRRLSRAERWAYARLPFAQRLARGAIYALHEWRAPGFTRKPALLKAAEPLALRYLKYKVPDPALRAALTPRYRMGCKRILIASDYYPALQRPNVAVVTEPIERVLPQGLRTRDGRLHALDAIVFATGFDAAEAVAPFEVHGRDGADLNETWRRDGPSAYLGTSVAGFPNLFMLVGPNTGLGHNSMVYMIESQLNHVLDALARMDARGECVAEVRAEVQQRYNAELQQRLAASVWATGGCSSWYQMHRPGHEGRITTLWPGSTLEFRRRTRRLGASDYRFGGAGS
jgi:cation diffusion facilitator CzcD-associated flavoprotein CzcO